MLPGREPVDQAVVRGCCRDGGSGAIQAEHPACDTASSNRGRRRVTSTSPGTKPHFSEGISIKPSLPIFHRYTVSWGVKPTGWNRYTPHRRWHASLYHSDSLVGSAPLTSGAAAGHRNGAEHPPVSQSGSRLLRIVASPTTSSRWSISTGDNQASEIRTRLVRIGRIRTAVSSCRVVLDTLRVIAERMLVRDIRSAIMAGNERTATSEQRPTSVIVTAAMVKGHSPKT